MVQAAMRVLRPLVRLLIRHGITFPFVSQKLKSVYLDVAVHDVVAGQGRATDSRLSVLTGVHRKDIRRYREDTEGFLEDDRKGASLAAQIVSAWLSTPPYCDEAGSPLPLFRAAALGSPNFEALADDASRRDVRARSVLDELIANGTVTEHAGGKLMLNEQAYIPAGDFAAKADFFSRGLEQHIDVAARNLDGGQPPLLERAVYANNLTADQIAQLHTYALEQSRALLRELNQRAKQMQRQNAATQQPLQRFHFGVYFNARTQDADLSEDAKDEN